MKNIANIELFLRKKFPKYNIIYAKPPSYIKKITGLSEDNFFISILSKDYKRTDIQNDSFNTFASVNQSHDLDLTGSPLKDNCDIDAIDLENINLKVLVKNQWEDCEVQYEHINIDEARQMIIDINMNSKNFKDDIATVWILSDPSDNEKIVLLETCIDFKTYTRGIVSIEENVHCSAIKMENLLSKHYTYISKLHNVEAIIETFFNIKSNTTLKLTTKTNFYKPQYNFSINNYINADILLCQNIDIGDDNSIAYDLWYEILTLNAIKDCILKYKKQKNDKIDPNYQNDCDKNIFNLKEIIHKYLTDINFCLQEKLTENNNVIENVVQKSKFRDCYDITDKIWNILKDTSYANIKASLHYIFQCAAKFNIVNMPTNKTRLAELIRIISEKHLAIPCLNGAEPLELLLEIGLEKLIKDYEYIFCESKICNAKDLNLNETQIANLKKSPLNARKSLYPIAAQESKPASIRNTLLHNPNVVENNDKEIIGFQNSRFDQKKVGMQLDKLVQVHLLLEHLILIAANLDINNDSLSIIKDILQEQPTNFNKVINNKFDYLEIPMSLEQVLAIIEKNKPYAKRIVLASEFKFKRVQNTFYFCIENIFPNNNILSATQPTEQDTTDVNYHQLHYLQISTKY